MKKIIVLTIFLALGSGWASAQAPEVYSLVEIELSRANMEQIQELGLPLDCCYCAPTNRGSVIFHVPVNKFELDLLKKRSIDYRVVMDDVSKYYEQRALSEDNARAETIRESYGTKMPYGNLAGFYKLEEIDSTLENLYKNNKSKNIIAKKFVIGKSYEGRDIWAIKISDNADIDEGERETQVLYTALTHAREPGGMMTVFYYMYYLLENYSNDARVKNIVDNCELYFIPCVNPDGYYYNQKSNPNGGGMCRKNRHGSGIDLNRNFGPYKLWNHANGGSSTSPGSQTYRGTAPFSEPEAQAYRDFVHSMNFRAALNYHTYSNLLIYPWGYVNKVANPLFRTMAVDMTKVNGYRYGTAPGLLYAVRGDSDDWLFQEENVFAMTPEVGGWGDGFWPRKSRIFPLAQENLEANLLLAEYALKMK